MNSLRNIVQSTPVVMRELILLSFFTIIYSCSGGLSSVYNFDYPLTDKIAKSNSSLIEIKIPQGWFVAENDENNITDLWLVKDDYSATIKFVLVNVNEDGVENVSPDQLRKVAGLSKLVIKTKFGKTFKGFSEEEIIENGAGNFLAFQYLDEKNLPVRTIILKHGAKYYEVTAYTLASAKPAEIFKTQNSVLASLK